MEDLKKIQEFFSKPLEEGKQLDIVDFAKVVQAVTKTGHPVTVLLVPKFNEIEVLTGMNAPDDMLFDLSNAVDSLGYGRNDIIIAADSSNLSRREYSQIRRVNGGAKDYFEESVNEGTFDQGEIAIYMGNDDSGTTHIFKRGKGYYGYNDEFDFEASSKEELQQKLDKWGYELLAGSLEENRKLTYNDFVRMVRDDMMAGAAPDEYPSDERVKKDAKYLYNRYLQGASVDDLFEAVNENALGFNDSRLTSDQHRDLDYAVRGDSAYTFGNDPYADDQLRYKYAVKMGFLEEYNTGIYYDPAKERNAVKAKKASKSGLEKIRDFVKKVMKEEEITVDDATEFKLNLKHLLDKHVIQKEDLSDYEEKEADYDKLYSDYLYKMVKEVATEKGYSKFLVSKDNPKGETSGLDTKTMNKILMNVIKDIDETIQLGKQLDEKKLCKKGEAYRKRRMAAGEKSSAYLSGRAVKVCKGQMKG